MESPAFRFDRYRNGVFIRLNGERIPVYFSSPEEEVMTARLHVGITCANSMGMLLLSGGHQLDLLKLMLPKRIENYSVGNSVVYTCLSTAEGGLAGDFTLFLLNERESLVLCDSKSKPSILRTLELGALTYCRSVSVTDIGARTSMLAVQGPKTEAVISSSLGVDLNLLKKFNFMRVTRDGGSFLLSRTGYTGLDGVEIVFPKANTSIWKQVGSECIKQSGTLYGILAAQVLRIEAGLSHFGTDFDSSDTIATACIDNAVDQTKAPDWPPGNICRNDLKRYYKVGVIIESTSALPKGALLFNGVSGGTKRRKIGELTSCCYSPTLNKIIALAKIDNPASQRAEIHVSYQNKEYSARLCELPFC